MLRRLPILFVLTSALAAPPPGPAARATGYERLHDDALVARLTASAAEDIKARRLEEALAKAMEAEALRPKEAVILNTKGAALVELRRYEEAEKVLQASIALDPAAFAPEFNLGEMLMLQKKYSDAADRFASLLSRFGALPRLKYNLYLSSALAGEKDRAADALALMRFPADGIAWYFAFAADRLLAGHPAEAKDLIAAAQAIHFEEMSSYRDTLQDTGLLK